MENPDRVTYFAATDARGQRAPFGIKQKDRARHTYVIGKTGMGKSTLLENMAIQDIRNGEGLAIIDPHGSFADKMLDYIPEERINDVVYFAPFDLDNPLAFNVMEDVGYDKRHLVVSGLMATFKKIWQDAWSARMEYILTNTLLALLEYPDATLLGVNRMYTDKAYRKLVVDNIKDPVVKDFWTKEFAGYTDRFTQEATPAIQNKIGQFSGNPLIRNIIGQPKSSFDIREMMDNKKILLVNLSKGLVGDTNTQLLGSMLTTRIFLAAMSRADKSAADMARLPNFYFYVDEFQNFANETFSEILSEARKYKLNLTIAHQYVEQMEEEVRAAVFGNVGTTIAFRVGPFDAEVLETVFMPEFTKEDLVNLGFAQIYLTLMIDGVGSRPFSAVTIPPIETPPQSFREKVIAASRANYGHVRTEVEEAVMAELASTAGESGPVEPSQRRAPGPRSAGGREGGPQGARPPRASQPAAPRPAQAGRADTWEMPRRESGPRPKRDMAPRENHIPPAQEKTADDLKSILRTMTKGAQEEKKKTESAKEQSLKGALASVLEKSGQATEGPREKVAPPQAPRPRRVEGKPIQEASSTEPSARPAPTLEAQKPFEVPEAELRNILKGND